MKSETPPVRITPKPAALAKSKAQTNAKASATPKAAPGQQEAPKAAAGPPPKPDAGISGRRRVMFRVEAEPGSEVFVAGSFNGWEPTAHPLADKSGKGTFERQIYAAPGPLEYKFVINGEWVIDARCSAWVPNAMGSLNSLIDVR